MAGFKKFLKQGLAAPHVWPVGFLALVVAPIMAICASVHQLRGPDVRIWKNFETNKEFENRKFKYISSVDHSTYVHPRPKFNEEEELFLAFTAAH